MSVADFPRDIFNVAKGTFSQPKQESAENTGAAPTDNAGTAAGSDLASIRSNTDQHSTVTNESTASIAPSVSADSTASTRSTAPSEGATTPKHTRSESATSNAQRPGLSSPNSMNENLDRALGAGKSINNIVTTGVKSPMNFCLGLARGFRNAPKLYNDDTVRKPEKVNSFESGLKVASREFGFGFYDGISGLVTQPIRGAQKEGGMGLLKGIGKGIGGLVLKPAAGKLFSERKHRYYSNNFSCLVHTSLYNGWYPCGDPNNVRTECSELHNSIACSTR